ncbi:SurA N-terminal domain-containing protein [Mannheimia sp. AT1]|uniref:Periplasmic chaperone PpiD n=1 Tax=Mannheimia cairinae TaxID=3025936 RepID=A0ABT5MU95_9PAST|nr:SurA N-terminal domain-containing protein [Mannheimia cairinae]MDD0824438.1 SurA N-terminal domain-containing protein [Mannheimia cairinae]MDD0825539.1 SurA N-terminal domain-containing protein [Mannheimia cairinae]
MIEKMHEWTGSLAFKIIFALISISFVIGGIGSGLISSNNSVAKVNGEEISQQLFNNALNRQQNMLNAEMGSRFWDLMDNPEYAAQLHRSVLNGLIDEELLRQYAKDLKLGISADQIKSEIVNSEMFQQDGKFSNELYQQTLRNNNLSADNYAAIVQEGMLQSQLQEGIINSDFSVPAQQEFLAKLLLQQREVRLAEFSVAKEMQNQTASAEELQAYYDANKAKLLAPEKLVVEYVSLSPKDVEKNIQITDEQVQTYYDRNQADYVTKGESHLAHIQVATEEDAQAVEQELKNGANFAELAKSKSTDALSANNGGDLGWARAGTFPKAFDDAAANLNIGEVSSVVKVDNTYHIIKLLDRKAEQMIELAQVKDRIVETIRQELVLTEYSKIAREMANRAFENNSSLEEVAKVADLEVQKTPQFTQQNVPVALQHEKVLRALFEGELRQSKQNSDALDVGNDINPQTLFVRVSEYEAERPQTFDEAKSAIENFVKADKAEKALQLKAVELLSALNEGKEADITFNAPQTLVYMQAEVENPSLARTVFAMKKEEGKTAYQLARNQQGDVVIVALDKIVDGDNEQFKALLPQFEQANHLILRDELLKDLRARASVEVNEDFMKQN